MENNQMNRLKVVLAEKNIQSKYISEQLGVSRATVSKWINNKIQPNLENINKLAILLDVDYTELLRLDRKTEKKDL
jgi:transcriptional regulator with XRE-family HTH domain